MKTGGCLCGNIKFEITAKMRPVVYCHCTQCRKTSGHFVAATAVDREGVDITGNVCWYQSSEYARRGFCANCGSSLFWDQGDENIHIFVGSIDGATQLDSTGHIFCDDKGDYYQINDGLPQCAGYDPEALGEA